MSTEEIERFRAFENYDFDKDSRFQAGLPSLLQNGQGKSEQEQLELVQRAKWFYYTKFVSSFDYNEYRQWAKDHKYIVNTSDNNDDVQNSESKATPSKDSNTEDEPPRRLTFQEIVEKIEKGEEIPGIKQIPNKLNEAPPSEAKLSARPKPWETKKNENESENPNANNDSNVNNQSIDPADE
ncbi:hypothetical protein Unana1_03467 [Umbelopsis nana]